MLRNLAAAGSIHEDAPVVVHLRIEIGAPPARVWAILIGTLAWPTWNKQIESVTTLCPLVGGARFTWKTGGTTIHSQVQLFEPQRRLAWTGTALTVQAIHVWELTPESGGHTLIAVKESMDGPWMSAIYPSQKLAAADNEWLAALKREAERNSQPSR